MTTLMRTKRRRALKFPILLLAPLFAVVFFGAVVPRIVSRTAPVPGQIDWAAMHGYEFSVARRYPHVRRGYEHILISDQRQLRVLDNRIASSTDPEMRAGLERQRVVVTSGINVVEQILAHFPKNPDSPARSPAN